jgi:hypothetical protein
MKSINARSPRAAAGVSFLAVALGCLLCLPTPARAQSAIRFKSSPLGSKVKIDGTSNLHDWSMTGQLISGYLELPAGVTLDPAQAALAGVTGGKLNARAEVFIAVSSLQSGTQGMDEVMQQAMKAADYPRIQYHLTEMVFKEPHTAGTPLKFDTKGDLSLAGVTNKISMPVSIESAEKSKLKVVGSIPLKMTDFNVSPPVKLGVFKTTNEVTISFEWMLNPPKPAEPKGQ